jgi:hypothetical protein
LGSVCVSAVASVVLRAPEEDRWGQTIALYSLHDR